MIGQSLGHFEITAKLGEGGMGEVYEARDTRLGRTVAIKILRRDDERSAELLARFERECRAISSIDHPNICKLYDVGREGDLEYLVMQKVEGDTLASRLQSGPLPLDEAYRVAIEVSDALAAAHKQGVVHRDLKPGNIMLGRSGAIVLDFGLAKLVARPEGDEEVNAELPTEQIQTRRGTILGTPQYLTPEQLEGRPADARSDIFAFGAVLYEIVTGCRAFDGDNASHVLTSVMTRQPPSTSSINSRVPPGLERIIDRCLAKDPEDRWQSAVDIREELKWIEAGGAIDRVGAEPKAQGIGFRWKPIAGLLVGLVIGSGVTVLVRSDRRGVSEPPRSPQARFSIEFDRGEWLYDHNSASIALSPDGSLLAYVTNQGSERAIHLRPLDESQGTRLPGTERASSPVFSPDGEWVAFEAGGKLKRAHIRGGKPDVVANVAFFAGATWGRGDFIVYAPSFMRGLFAIPASGGESKQLTTPASGHAHIWPEFLPDGKHVIFSIWTGEGYDQGKIAIVELQSGDWKLVADGGFFGRYSPSGHLLYMRASNLFAAPFDLESLELTGPSFQLLEEVQHDAIDGAGFFAVSRAMLVYARRRKDAHSRPLVWVDRSGDRSPVTSHERLFGTSRISPDGTRLAVSLEEEVLSIWGLDLARDTMTRISFGSDDHNIAWSPDGSRVAFESGRQGVHQVFVRPANGTGEPVVITSGNHDHYLCDWSPDGKAIAYVEYHPQTGADIWMVDPTTKESHPVLTTRFNERDATFSPDGRWLAYSSDETGQYEVYVRPILETGPKWLVSSDGGEEPSWSRSDRELFYRSGGRMMAVSFSTTPDFATGPPEMLFEGLFHYANFPTRTYDVSSDGRFVMTAEPAPELSTEQLQVIVNWSEVLGANSL